ncbi:MAG TPA: hypothetical protein VLE72_02265 [Candidatus Saccharimonadales bacterium]|nr:hypothetical protein [Candidatus Saccharimonadales bacterium]
MESTQNHSPKTRSWLWIDWLFLIVAGLSVIAIALNVAFLIDAKKFDDAFNPTRIRERARTELVHHLEHVGVEVVASKTQYLVLKLSAKCPHFPVKLGYEFVDMTHYDAYLVVDPSGAAMQIQRSDDFAYIYPQCYDRIPPYPWGTGRS